MHQGRQTPIGSRRLCSWSLLAGIAGLMLVAWPGGTAAKGIDPKPRLAAAAGEWRWTDLTIPVCWENPQEDDAKERGWVKKAVEDNYEKFSDLDFVSWNQCVAMLGGPARTRVGININILRDGDTSSSAHRGMSAIDGTVSGMKLQFGSLKGDCAIARKGCIKTTALHEFGHALGFIHEHRRADADRKCADKHPAKQGDPEIAAEDQVYLTAEYDKKSVMNYCTGLTRHFRGTLSRMDIIGLQSVYGRGSEYSPATWRGRATCKGKYAAATIDGVDYRKAFRDPLKGCYSCPVGYRRTTLHSVTSAKACKKKGGFLGIGKPTEPARYRGTSGCPKTNHTRDGIEYGHAWQNVPLDQCYSCPVDYKRHAVLGSDFEKIPKACKKKS